MSKVLAIDPGPTESAYVLWDGSKILNKGKESNWFVIGLLQGVKEDQPDIKIAIEMIGHYGTGMPAGKEVFDTCVWIGRFIQICGQDNRVLRPTVKTHICGSARAKDSNVRQALIDYLGAPGTKKKPGGTYGVSKDIWQALALAVYWTNKHEAKA
jgi:hypothetical protein